MILSIEKKHFHVRNLSEYKSVIGINTVPYLKKYMCFS